MGRGSSSLAHTGPLAISASTGMVRNLTIPNRCPSRPMRSCRNSTGPGEESLIAAATSSMRGASSTSAPVENATSNTRLASRFQP